MAHYSKQQNFTFDAMQSAKNSLNALKVAVLEHKNGTASVDVSEYVNEFKDAINNDLNMPVALAVVWKMLKEPRSTDVYNAIMDFNRILGFDFDIKLEEDIPQEVKDLAEARWQAKQERNWAVADELRGKITSLGYQILDSKEGYDIKKL